MRTLTMDETLPSRASSTTLALARRLVATDSSLASTVLRLTLAVVMFPHGAQKLFGWFGGYGFAGTLQYFTEGLGIPYLLGVAVILLEVLAPLALVAGIGTRLAAASVGGIMTVATLMVHLPYGFFMNWSGQQSGEGFEFHLLALGIALALLVAGGGRFSVDRHLAARRRDSGEGRGIGAGR